MARFWEGTLTYRENGTGETKVKNVKLVSTEDVGAPITTETNFFDISDAYDGFDICCSESIRLTTITEETEEEFGRVDYNKKKFQPVTVKSYLMVYDGYVYTTTLEGIDEYDTTDVPLEDLIGTVKSAMTTTYGGSIDVIDADFLTDGKTYVDENEYWDEKSGYPNGMLGLGRGGRIDEVEQQSLTGYNFARGTFTESAYGKVITLVGVSGMG